jgi:hypothetical protein
VSGSVANGKAGGLRERIARNQSERERAIADLEGSDWEEEEVTENHFHLPPGTTLEADRTGKLRAVSIPDSDPPESDVDPPPKLTLLGLAWLAVRRMPPLGVVLVTLAGIAAYVFLKRP